MRAFASLVCCVLVVGSASADDGTKAKLVGTWEVIKGTGGLPKDKSVLEFGKDGKYKAKMTTADGLEEVEGVYEVERDHITITTLEKGREKSRSYKIVNLIGGQLSIDDPKGGGSAELKQLRK